MSTANQHTCPCCDWNDAYENYICSDCQKIFEQNGLIIKTVEDYVRYKEEFDNEIVEARIDKQVYNSIYL